MNGDPSRRKFLTTLSLAGAALMAGGKAAIAQVANRRRNLSVATKRKKVWAWVDENGCLELDDAQLEAALYRLYRDSGPICVRIDVPGSEGNKVNSLCNC